MPRKFKARNVRTKERRTSTASATWCKEEDAQNDRSAAEAFQQPPRAVPEIVTVPEIVHVGPVVPEDESAQVGIRASVSPPLGVTIIASDRELPTDMVRLPLRRRPEGRGDSSG
jgi:hypothetical protein